MSKFTVKTLKPRNPMVAAALFRKAGSHAPLTGSERQLAMQALRRELAALERPHPRQSP
jgi:hypothetical protein